MAKQYLSRNAGKKTGTATPISEKITTCRCRTSSRARLRGEVAERDGEHDGEDHARRCVSSIVAGSRVRKMSKASWPGSTAVEAPNSPRERALEELQVLDVDRLVQAAGASVRAARRRGWPARRGSPRPCRPGSERSQTNRSRDRTNTTPTIWSRRRMMNRSHGAPVPTTSVAASDPIGGEAATATWQSISGRAAAVTPLDRDGVELLGRQRARRRDPRRPAPTTRAGGEWLIGRPGRYSSMICWLIFLYAASRSASSTIASAVLRSSASFLPHGYDAGAEVVLLEVAEERADEVVRGVVVTGPAEQVGVVLAGVALSR